MKMPIAWHEDCLRNMEFSYHENLRQFEVMERELNRERQALAVYINQIESAKAEGRDGFDAERYMRYLKSQ